MPFSTQFGRGLAYGLYNLGSDFGTILDVLGAPQTGQRIKDYFADDLSRYAIPQELQGSVLENPELLGNPEWWGYGLGNIAPSIMASLVPGMGATRVARGLGAGAKMASRIGAGVAGLGGGLLEASGSYEEAIRRGMPRDEARARFFPTVGAVGALNALPAYQLFRPMAKGGLPGRMLGHGLAEGLTEWAEEPTQAAIHGQDVLEAAKQGFNVFPLAAVSGGLLGAPFAGRSEIPVAEVEDKVKNLITSPSIFPPPRPIPVASSLFDTGKEGEGYAFVSPNQGKGMSLDEAIKQSRSDEEGRYISVVKAIDDALGIEGDIAPAIGVWNGEAEPAVAEYFPHVDSIEELLYNAAWKGKLGNQLAVLGFINEKEGPDSLYTAFITAPMKQVAAGLEQFGFNGYTLVRSAFDDATGVTVFDPGGENIELFDDFAEAYDVQFHHHVGRGEFLGADSRPKAQKTYTDWLKKYEASHPSSPRYRPERFGVRADRDAPPPIFFQEGVTGPTQTGLTKGKPTIFPVPKENRAGVRMEESGGQFTVSEGDAKLVGEVTPKGLVYRGLELEGERRKDVVHRLVQHAFNQAFGRGEKLMIPMDVLESGELDPRAAMEFQLMEFKGGLSVVEEDGFAVVTPEKVMADGFGYSKAKAKRVLAEKTSNDIQLLKSHFEPTITVEPDEDHLNLVNQRANFDREISVQDHDITHEKIMVVLAPPDPYQQGVIAAALQDLEATGRLNRTVIERVATFGVLYSTHEGHGGLYDSLTSALVLDGRIMDALRAAPTVEGYKSVRSTIAHELGHSMTVQGYIDDDGRPTSRSELDTSPSFHIDMEGIEAREDGKPMPTDELFGPVTKELFEAHLEDNNKVDLFLAYPFVRLQEAYKLLQVLEMGMMPMQIGPIMGLVPIDAEMASEMRHDINDIYRWVKREAFAQGWALYITAPEFTRSKLPVTYKYMSEVQNAADKMGRTGRPYVQVSNAIRALGSYMVSPEIQGAGFGAAAQAGAQGQQAGPGVRGIPAESALRGAGAGLSTEAYLSGRKATVLNMFSQGTLRRMNAEAEANALIEILGTSDTTEYNDAKRQEYIDGSDLDVISEDVEVDTGETDENGLPIKDVEERINEIVFTTPDGDRVGLMEGDLEDFLEWAEDNWEKVESADDVGLWQVMEYLQEQGDINGPEWIDFDEVADRYEQAIKDIIGDEWDVSSSSDGTAYMGREYNGGYLTLRHGNSGAEWQATYEMEDGELLEESGEDYTLSDAADSAESMLDEMVEQAEEAGRITRQAMPRPTKKEARRIRRAAQLRSVVEKLSRVEANDPLMAQIIAAVPTQGELFGFGPLTEEETAAVQETVRYPTGEDPNVWILPDSGDTSAVLLDGDRVIWRGDTTLVSLVDYLRRAEEGILSIKPEQRGGRANMDTDTWEAAKKTIKVLGSGKPTYEKAAQIRKIIKKFYPGDTHIQSRADKTTREIDRITKMSPEEFAAEKHLPTREQYDPERMQLAYETYIAQTKAGFIKNMLIDLYGEGRQLQKSVHGTEEYIEEKIARAREDRDIAMDAESERGFPPRRKQLLEQARKNNRAMQVNPTVKSREELPADLRDRMINEHLRAMRAGAEPGGAVFGTERQEQLDQLRENVGSVFPTVEEELAWREERKRPKEAVGYPEIERGATYRGSTMSAYTSGEPPLKTYARTHTPQETLERARRGRPGPGTGGGRRAGPRGVQTNADTFRMAELLGTTPREVDRMMRRKLGEAYNAEQLAQAASIVEQESIRFDAEIERFMRKVDDDTVTSDDIVRANDAALEALSLADQFMGVRAEAGRALQIFKKLKSTTEKAREINRVMGGEGMVGLRMAALSELTLGERMKLLRDEDFLFGPLDKFQEAWLAALLSGPQTHVVNITSNFLVQLLEDVERFVAAGVGKFHGGEKVTFGEAITRLFGWGSGSVVGVKEMARAMRSEEYMIEVAQKMERHFRSAKISGKKGKLIRLPFRLLTAEDMYFKGLTLSKELRALAYRRSRTTGESVEEILANPPLEMLETAKDAADRATFTNPLGTLGKGYLRMMNHHPLMRFITPFVTTPTNIVKFAGRRTLLGPLFEDVRADLKAGGARRDLAVARMLTGTSIMGTVAMLAAQGLISGQGPEDPAKKAGKYAAGWQPYSVKLGNQWVSFSRFEPAGMLVGVAADMAEMYEQMDEADVGEVLELALGSFFKNITSKTFLRGLSDLVSAVTDPERYGERWIQSIAGTAVPTGIAQIARTQDPYMRRIDTLMDKLRSRIPGQSQQLLTRRDMFGNPIKTEGGIGPDIISPAYISTIVNDPVAIELDRLGQGKRAPSKRIRGVELKPREHDYYHEQSGQLAHRMLSRLMQANGWKRLSDDAKRDIIDRVYITARAAARRATVRQNPDIARRYYDARLQ